MALTPKQRAFVREYLVDANATQAAIRAGYSKASAHNQGARMMKNDEVYAAIAAGMDRVEKKAIATREERMAFYTATMRDPEAQALARLRAAELLGKTEGDFIERHEHSGELGGPLTIVLKRKGA